MHERSLAARPAVVGPGLDDVDLLDVVTARLGADEQGLAACRRDERQRVGVAVTERVDLVEHRRIADERVRRRHRVGIAVLEGIDSEDLPECVVALASTGGGRELAAVTVGDVEQASVGVACFRCRIEGDLFDGVVVHGHPHAEDLAVAGRSDRSADLCELDEHAVGLDGSVDVAEVVVAAHVGGSGLHRRDVELAVGGEVGVEGHGSQAAVRPVGVECPARRGLDRRTDVEEHLDGRCGVTVHHLVDDSVSLLDDEQPVAEGGHGIDPRGISGVGVRELDEGSQFDGEPVVGDQLRHRVLGGARVDAGDRRHGQERRHGH